MKQFIWGICLLLILIGCKGKSENPIVNNGNSIVQTEKVPDAVDVEQTICDTLAVGENNYIISLHRYPDTTLPCLVDLNKNLYYDNAVNLEVRLNNECVYSNKITKQIFSQLIPQEELESEPFYGMNLDKAKSNSHHLCFTAQVGWAGEGPAFYLFLNLKTKSFDIERDLSAFDAGYEDSFVEQQD